MKKIRQIFSLILSCTLLFTGCYLDKTDELNPNKPIIIKFCTYYNDKQLDILKGLVDKYNVTEGLKSGVIVEMESTGSLAQNTKILTDSANEVAGSIDFPDVFVTYKGVYHYFKDKKEIIDFNDFFTKEELSKFDSRLLDVGRFENKDKISMMPLGASTYINLINTTDFDDFAKKANISYDDITTYEGIAKSSQKYYEYTDSLTPEKHDGKALYGIDSIVDQVFKILSSMNSKILVGDNENPKINFQKEKAKKLWDIYYVPIIKGYYAKYGKYATEDLKTGRIVMSTNSTSSSIYTVDKVMDGDDFPRDVKIKALSSLKLKDFPLVSIQQGGGIFVTKTNKLKEKASINFVKWLLNKENNAQFCLKMGYSPVRVDNIDEEYIRQKAKEYKIKDVVVDAILTSATQMRKNKIYVSPNIDKFEDLRLEMSRIFDEDIYKKRKELLQNVSSGANYDEMIKKYTSEEEFEKWYAQTLKSLEMAIQK